MSDIINNYMGFSGSDKRDRNANEYTTGALKVDIFGHTVRLLIWYSHVNRREDDDVGRNVTKMLARENGEDQSGTCRR